MGNEANHSGDIQLAEMIQTLRSELEKAQAASKGAEIKFKTEKVELELQVAISRKTTGEGGVEFWVVKAGAEHERSTATTHSFKLSLVPVNAITGKRVLVADESEDPISRD